MTRRARSQGSIDSLGPNLWRVRLSLGDSGTGRRRRFSRVVHGTAAEARAVLADQLAFKRAGRASRTRRQRFAAFAAEFCNQLCPDVTARTREGYRAVLARYALPRLGGFYLDAITQDHVRMLQAELTARGLGARTVRQFHTVLHTCLAAAQEVGRVAFNAAAGVKLPEEPYKEMRALTRPEVGQFLDKAAKDAWAALWFLMIDAGLRVAEAMGVKWEDVTEDGLLRVRRTLLRVKGGGWAFGKIKTKRPRVIPLGEDTLRVLAAHGARQAALRLAAGPDWQPHDLIFTNAFGAPAPLRTIYDRHFLPLLLAAGCPRIRMYDLRHTMATLALDVPDPNPKAVSERLGHGDIAITLRTYSHVLPHMQQDLTRKLAEQRGAARRAVRG